MSEISYDAKVEVVKACIGFGKRKVSSCWTCRHAQYPPPANVPCIDEMRTLECGVGLSILGVAFPVSMADICERHEERR